LANLPAFLWLTRIAPKASISARSNSLTNLVSALKAGLGVGPLPLFIGDTEPDLMRCFPPVDELAAELWLIIREDVRQAPHIRAFVDFLAAHLRARLADA
jgi:DNA-binding transcriptional LysR family regulator